MSTVITQSSYRKSLTGLGLGILLLGVALFFAKIKVIYDLPVLMMIIGAWVAIQNGMRLYKPGHNIQDIEINAKTLNNVLTNYAIIIAMVVLVLIICILQPRFMQDPCGTGHYDSVINQAHYCSWYLLHSDHCRM